MSVCKSCKRPIVWLRTESGKMIPLDIGERPDGNLVVKESRTVVVVKPGEGRWVSHFATCPGARIHRK